MTLDLSRCLAFALAGAIEAAFAQPGVPDITAPLAGPRIPLTAFYSITEDGERIEECREDRYADRSVRLACVSASGMSVRIDNEETQAHYELAKGTWTRYVLAPSPLRPIVIPSHMLGRLAHEDSRASLLALLPPDHREAYVWKSGHEFEAVVIPSLNMLPIWRRRAGGEIMQLVALSLDTPVAELAPSPEAQVRVDRRARRTRLF